MPTYEMTVLFKMLPKEELFNAVKRTATTILAEGGILRKLDGLGVNVRMPYRTNAHGQPHQQASYFLYTFDSPTASVSLLKSKYNYDVDIIKATVYKQNLPFDEECTLEDELKPAPYREPVIKAIQKLEKKKRVTFPLNTGTDYNPLP